MTEQQIDQRLRLPGLEQWLTEHDVAWRLDPEIPLERVDLHAGLANQVRHEPIDQDTVDRYRDDIDAGDIFPALLLREVDRGVVGTRLNPLGGNHRLAAYLSLDRATVAGYVITCDDVTADLAAYQDNRHHGKPTTVAENVTHAMRLHKNGGLSVAEAARAAGVNRIHVDQRLGAERAGERAQRFGLVSASRSIRESGHLEWRKIGVRCRYDLSRILDDGVFTRTVELVQQRIVATTAVAKLATRVNELSTGEALGLLGELAAAEEGRVRNTQGRPHKAHTHPAFALCHQLDQVMRFEPKPVVDDCPTPEQREQTRGQIRAAARKLIAIDKALEAASAKPHLASVGP